MTGILCPYCQADLSSPEVRDGRCLSCGKEIPPAVFEAYAMADAVWKQDRLMRQYAFVGWMLTGVILGIAAFAASQFLFNFPPPEAELKWVQAWAIGSVVVGGVLLSSAYVVLRDRKPKMVSLGLVLLYLVCFALGVLTVVMSLYYTFFT